MILLVMENKIQVSLPCCFLTERNLSTQKKKKKRSFISKCSVNCRKVVSGCWRPGWHLWWVRPDLETVFGKSQGISFHIVSNKCGVVCLVLQRARMASRGTHLNLGVCSGCTSELCLVFQGISQTCLCECPPWPYFVHGDLSGFPDYCTVVWEYGIN